MRPERWWSVILTMGLLMALSPLSAQAGPNRPFAPQPNRQAFNSPQPRAHTNSWNSQPHRWQQPRGHAYGWHGQNRQWHQPHRNAYGWNGHQRQWHHPYGNAYGWNGHHRQGDQYRHAYGRNDQHHQWNQQRNAYGGNDQQRQWQQSRPSFAQGDRPGNRQFQPPNGGQQNNHGSFYNRAGYPVHPQSPNIAPNSSGYSHNTTIPADQTGRQPSFRHPDASGNAPRPQGQSSSGVI